MRAALSAAFLLALLASAGSSGATPPASPLLAARPLCESLFVPDGYALVCETRIEDGRRSDRAVVRPSGVASPLAELAVRPLDPAEAPLAWTDPGRWLREQVAVDVTRLSTTLRDASATGPLAHPAARATVDGLLTMLAGWSRLPLQACEPEDRAGRRELRCRWGVEPLALEMNLRLVEAGDRRYALSYRAADEQRLRHLEAIANSFRPG